MRKRKSNLMLRLASLLLACVIISTYALCGLLAKYATSGGSKDDARVITFNNLYVEEAVVDKEGFESFKDGKALLVPGVDLIKDVTINFEGSEASTYVFAELTLYEELPEDDEKWVKTDHKYSLNIYDASTLVEGFSFDVLGTTLLTGEKAQTNTEKWYYLKSETIDTSTTKYVYYKILDPNKKMVKEPNVNQVDGSFLANDGIIKVSPRIQTVTTEKGVLTKYSQLLKTKIDIRAIVVQANGFESVEQAWSSVENN